jgi:hypothetical protein
MRFLIKKGVAKNARNRYIKETVRLIAKPCKKLVGYVGTISLSRTNGSV